MYQRILIPFSATNTAFHAVRRGVEVAADNGAVLRIVHVMQGTELFGAYERLAGLRGRLARPVHHQVQASLDEAVQRALAAGVAADALIVDFAGASLGRAIARVAVEWNADLLVVGSQGRRGLQRLLLGSQAEQIARWSTVPVLLVHPSPREVDAVDTTLSGDLLPLGADAFDAGPDEER